MYVCITCCEFVAEIEIKLYDHRGIRQQRVNRIILLNSSYINHEAVRQQKIDCDKLKIYFINSRAGVSDLFFNKRPDGTYSRLCRPECLCHKYSILLLYCNVETTIEHRQTYGGLCSNKILFGKTSCGPFFGLWTIAAIAE